MNKQNVVRTYNGLLFSTKKEWDTATCYMGETWNYAKWKKPDAKGDILNDFIYMRCSEQVNPQRQKVYWLVVIKGWGVTANEYRVSFEEGKIF